MNGHVTAYDAARDREPLIESPRVDERRKAAWERAVKDWVFKLIEAAHRRSNV